MVRLVSKREANVVNLKTSLAIILTNELNKLGCNKVEVTMYSDGRIVIKGVE